MWKKINGSVVCKVMIISSLVHRMDFYYFHAIRKVARVDKQIEKEVSFISALIL